jgi:hypothetical protein
MEVVAELRYDIPAMYKFHKQKSVRLSTFLLIRYNHQPPYNSVLLM